MSAEDESPTQARSLLELLDLKDEGGDSFVAPLGLSMGPRLFGGQVAAQALAAAVRTVRPEHRPQSLHAYFILAGKPDVPLRLDVERTRDGRSFTTRRVVASQDGAAIFEMSASFHGEEEGADWSTPVPLEAPDPELLPKFVGYESRPSGTFFEMRPVHKTDRPFAVPPYWARFNEAVPDGATAACVLTYMSDMGILAMARAPGQPIVTMASSLDHAIWFHRPYDPTEWHLFTGSPRSNFGARGLAVGGLFSRDGVLVASVVQEGLFRNPR
ncbi:MAG TPA: acyl-CoA thioesterase domain-containing protein [Acidimicrobiales bacterium]|nr:acyl-CoA thioesterase domain-containing protein [Acidimicrobiales bacterium]